MTTSNYFPRCVICDKTIHDKTIAVGNDMFCHDDCWRKYENERKM